MTKVNDGGPAFPIADIGNTKHQGMSLRDWFAGQVAVSLADQATPKSITFEANLKAIAQVSYQLADAMLAERAKGGA